MVFFTIGILAFERPFLAFAKYILTIEALPILRKWYFFTKIVLTYCEKNCDREKLLKFDAEGQEFAKNRMLL